MALHLSPHTSQHNVFAHSPESRWAILPDLPYGGRPRSSTASSSNATPNHTASAPTSPLNRPRVHGMVQMNHITPFHLLQPPGQQAQPPLGPLISGKLPPLSSRGTLVAPVSQSPPQQPALHQPTQPIAINQSFQSVSAPHRISPPSSINPLLAPLSSSNLATLDHSIDHGQAKYRSKSRTRVLAQTQREESGSDTERGGSDSDVTVIDHRRAGKSSYSQTDLAAYRERFVTAGPSTTNGPAQAVAGTSAKPSVAIGTSAPIASGSGSNNNGISSLNGFRDPETITLPRQRKSPKTPPTRPLPITAQTAPSSAAVSGAIGIVSPGKSPRSRSSTSLSSMRMTSTSPKATYSSLGRSPGSSPRNSSIYLAPLTPLSSSSSLSPLNRARDSLQPTGSDADAENDSTESSVTFGTRSRSGIRLRTNGHSATVSGNGNGLGLSLGPEEVPERKKGDDLIPKAIERMYHSSSLLYLRILAIVPACWGFLVLVQAFITGGIWHDVWPWGADFSKESIYHLSQISSEGHHAVTHGGVWKRAVRGDLLLSIAWAILTGHFCFRFTTGLTYRWRSYYDLLPVLVRLLALQGLCWSATYSTLSYLGPSQPLFAWAVIGVSTGFTYAVIMWLASNVLPDPEIVSRTRSRSRSQSQSPRTSPKRQPIFPVWGEAPLIAPPQPPEHFSRWERLNYKRRWDWEAVNREVGWKVGVLLLLTSAWVFWQIHIGWLVRVEPE